MNIVFDKFNSEIFNLRMGNIVEIDSHTSLLDLDYAIKEAKGNGFQHLNVKVATENKTLTNALLRRGFNLVDTQLMYCINPNPLGGQKRYNRVSYREFQEIDRQQVVNIAKTAYVLDQYHSDAELDNSLCDKYYAEWANNCCNGLSDKVLVALFLEKDRDEKVVGFLTMNYHGTDATVGLAAVDKRYRGNGIFSFLIENTLKMLEEEAIERLYYGTQISNSPVLRTMGKYNGYVEFSNHVLHLML